MKSNKITVDAFGGYLGSVAAVAEKSISL